MIEDPKGNEDGKNLFYADLYQWSARISGIAFGMVIPPIIGIWLDQYCGTGALFVILGAIFGMVGGFWQLIKIAQTVSKENHKANTGLDKSPDIRDNER
jgi:F0F1-type ATP synthase assembly protein I